MNSDVRDILELELSCKKEGNGKEKVRFYYGYKIELRVNCNCFQKKLKRLVEPIKRPSGVNREVWRLINKDDRYALHI